MKTGHKRLLGGTAGLAALGATTLGWALIEAHLFTLRAVQVPVLSPGSQPHRVLHLSDLHLTPSQDDKRRWVQTLALLEPDLVVVTGDFLGHRAAVPSVLDALAPLLDFPGIYTLGSNDYLAPRPINPIGYLRGPSKLDLSRAELPWGDLVSGLARRGWVNLNNAAVRIDLDGWSIDARGVDDPHIFRDQYELVSGPFDDSATLKLGVTHAPYLRVLDGMSGDGADLILAGHTHGGQICLPGYGTLVTNCDLDRKRARGLSSYPGDVSDLAGGLRPLAGSPAGKSADKDSTTGASAEAWKPRTHTSALHVSAGIGGSPYAPIRFACRPEATLLTLTARPS